MTSTRELMTQWESVEKMKLDLVNWLMTKQAQLQQISEKPAKLHLEPAQQVKLFSCDPQEFDGAFS